MKLEVGCWIEILSACRWERRIFVKYGKNGGVICVDPYCENNFLNGGSFKTNWFLKEHWREVKKFSYRPFTWEEREQLCDMWVLDKNGSNHSYKITGLFINNKGFPSAVYGGCRITFQKLFERYTFSDGSIIGVEE